MIEVKNLTKLYGDFIAIDDISFEVKKGEVVGFLGPNGAGKTTTMRIISCYLAPNKGEVSVAGYDILQHSYLLRQKIGYLPENTPLYGELNVLECLEFFAAMHDIPTQKRAKAILKVMESCGLKEKAKIEVLELSKGYCQRLGLAQAMIHDPDILILDEPTSGLDPNQIIEIRNLIKNIGKEKTVLLSTHIMQEVEATCDRVIIINRGRIVGQDTPHNLRLQGSLTNSLYLEVEGNIKDILRILEEIKGICGISRLDQEERGIHRLKLNIEDNLDLRKTINHTLLKNELELLEMRKETASLEDVFRELTK